MFIFSPQENHCLSDESRTNIRDSFVELETTLSSILCTFKTAETKEKIMKMVNNPKDFFRFVYFWWYLVIFGYFWWYLVLFGDVWWHLVMFDYFCWHLMIFGDIWCHLLILDDIWSYFIFLVLGVTLIWTQTSCPSLSSPTHLPVSGELWPYQLQDPRRGLVALPSEGSPVPAHVRLVLWASLRASLSAAT